MMEPEALRSIARRESRLDQEWFHLFSPEVFVDALTSEQEYRQNGHNGVLLLKNEQLRVVLEVARNGVEIGSHSVHGPTLVQIVSGSLRIDCGDETRVGHAGEMVVIPHDRPRTLRAEEDSVFLRVLSIDR